MLLTQTAISKPTVIQKWAALEKVESDEDKNELKQMVENHLKYTDSALAESLLQDWDNKVSEFVKVIPHDFKQMLSYTKSKRQRT